MTWMPKSLMICHDTLAAPASETSVKWRRCECIWRTSSLIIGGKKQQKKKEKCSPARFLFFFCLQSHNAVQWKVPVWPLDGIMNLPHLFSSLTLTGFAVTSASTAPAVAVNCPLWLWILERLRYTTGLLNLQVCIDLDLICQCQNTFFLNKSSIMHTGSSGFWNL